MVFEFGHFRLDTQLLELSGPAGPIPLEPKCLTLLILLVKERSRAVPKDEIFDTVWPNVIVTEASLSTAIRQIRRALEDDGGRQSFVKTVRGHGFRFVADVREQGAAQPATAIETSPSVPMPSSDGRLTVAIRPFQLVGADATQIAIAEAIPAELIATLSRLRWLSIIARGSSFRFGSANTDLQDMGVHLGAHFVVSGLVEMQGPGVAIFAQLSDTRTDQVIWSDRASGKLQDIYDLRGKIARDLTIALELRLPLHEADRLIHVPSESVDAWGHYHLGIRHMYRYNREDNEKAAMHFRQALALDPGFSRAYAGLSYTEFQNAFQHFKADIAHHRNLALVHAEEAIKLDPLDPFCNLIYGRAKWLSGDAEDGLIWVDRAIDLNPNYAFGYYNNATLNTVLCNSEIADRNIQMSLELSPLDPHLQSMYGTRALAAFVANDLPAAVAYADRATKAPNPHLYVHIIAAAIYAQSGSDEKAKRCVDAIEAKQVPFGTTEFLTHFNLRAYDRLDSMVATLSRLGL